MRLLSLITFILILVPHARADSEAGKEIYRQNCAPCHGVSGKGDGLGAQGLPVRPADHTDGAVMKGRSDAFLRDVISKGGSAMGLSPFMPAWNGMLNDVQIQNLVDYIRTLARPRN